MQSCSVPVWMRVFPKVPPMPTHMAENVLFWEMVIWGMVHEPLTPVMRTISVGRMRIFRLS